MYKIDFTDEPSHLPKVITGKQLAVIEEIIMGPQKDNGEYSLLMSSSGKSEGFKIIFRIVDEKSPFYNWKHTQFYAMKGSNIDYINRCKQEVKSIFPVVGLNGEQEIGKLLHKVLLIDFFEENGRSQIHGFSGQKEHPLENVVHKKKVPSNEKNVSELGDDDLPF